MKIKNYTDFKSNITAVANYVNEKRKPVVVTRGSKKPFVIISMEDLEDLNGYRETEYLMSSEENKKSLLKSIEELKEMNSLKNTMACS